MRFSRSGRGAAAVALTVAIAMMPGVAVAHGASVALGARSMPGAWSHALVVKPKKKSSGSTLGPEAAGPKRDAIRAAVADDVEAERFGAAADETEDNAAQLGDPISFQEAAELRYQQAKADRDIAAANAAIETATIALDVLHFYEAVDAGEAVSEWRPIDPATASSLVSDVEELIDRCEELITEIEAEQAAAEGTPAATQAEGKRKRSKKPGVGLIAAGSVASVVGAGGLSMVATGIIISARKQKEVESLTLPDDQARVDQLDREGSQANLIAYIGAGVAVVGVAAGVTLIVIGAKRRKEAGNAPSSARLHVLPTAARGFGGLSLTGRF